MNHPKTTAAEEVLRRYNDESLPDFCDPLTDVNQVGTFGNRPTRLACYRGNMNDIVALVEGGADVNAIGDMGSTPLHEAVEQAHAGAEKFLLDRGAKRDVLKSSDKHGSILPKKRGWLKFPD
ncbi:MAG TPA: ankyrin repeat domain-containing protein [Candidatus Sulfotelmatobacter sp.]